MLCSSVSMASSNILVVEISKTPRLPVQLHVIVKHLPDLGVMAM
jgi:hypothetical protein